MVSFLLISLILLAFYGALIAYYKRAWDAIPGSQGVSAGKEASVRISVLVPARNEEQNIRHCLESLSRQAYPKELYEVIVIDDHSTDNTARIVQEFAAEGLCTVRCLRLGELGARPVKAYKKFAIETGIGLAIGELIVATDADCWSGPDWLRTIAGFHKDTGAKFIAAPVLMIDTGRQSFLSLFQTLDFLTLQGITGAAVYRRFHSMCNGANLAYEKKAFLEVDGFRGIDSIPSGDDMLLMHKIYKKYPEQVYFLKDQEAIVYTRPEQTWGRFVNQRVRWASKADQYDDKRIFWVLLGVYVLNVLFIAWSVAACWHRSNLWPLLVLLALKTVVEYPFVYSVAAFFRQQRLMPWFPFLQPFHILYTVVIGWLGKFGSYRWKDRKVKK